MKVKMLTSVVYEGRKYLKGDEYDIVDIVAVRWHRHKIAQIQEPEPEKIIKQVVQARVEAKKKEVKKVKKLVKKGKNK